MSERKKTESLREHSVQYLRASALSIGILALSTLLSHSTRASELQKVRNSAQDTTHVNNLENNVFNDSSEALIVIPKEAVVLNSKLDTLPAHSVIRTYHTIPYSHIIFESETLPVGELGTQNFIVDAKSDSVVDLARDAQQDSVMHQKSDQKSEKRSAEEVNAKPEGNIGTYVSLGVFGPWSHGIFGQDTTIGVVDLGADFKHPQLKGHESPFNACFSVVNASICKNNKKEDFNIGAGEAIDGYAGIHGTTVAGTALSIAIDPSVDILSVVAGRRDANGNATYDYATNLAGYDYILSLAKKGLLKRTTVVGAWGWGSFSEPSEDTSPELSLILEQLVEEGIPVVFPTGNAGSRTEIIAPAGIKLRGQPLTQDGLFATTGRTLDGSPVDAVNYWAYPLLAVPSTNFNSANPTYFAPELYSPATGTSITSPMVAGGIALAFSAGMTDPREIESLFYSSSKDGVRGFSNVRILRFDRALDKAVPKLGFPWVLKLGNR